MTGRLMIVPTILTDSVYYIPNGIRILLHLSIPYTYTFPQSRFMQQSILSEENIQAPIYISHNTLYALRKGRNSLYLGNLVVLAVLVALVVSSGILIYHQQHSQQRLDSLNRDIASTTAQIHSNRLNISLELNNTNLTSFSLVALGGSGKRIVQLDISNNLLIWLSDTNLPRLWSLRTTNSLIQQFNNNRFPSLKEYQCSFAIKFLNGSVLGLEYLPDCLKRPLMMTNNQFPSLKKLELLDSSTQHLSMYGNEMPNVEEVMVANVSFAAIDTWMMSKARTIYIESQSTTNQIVIIRSVSSLQSLTIKTSAKFDLSFILSNVIGIDALQIPNLQSLYLLSSSVPSISTLTLPLVKLEIDSSKNFSVLNLDLYPNMHSCTIRSSDITLIQSSGPRSHPIHAILVDEASFNTLENNLLDAEIVQFVDNHNTLVTIKNNTFLNTIQILLGSGVKEISNNSLQTLSNLLFVAGARLHIAIITGNDFRNLKILSVINGQLKQVSNNNFVSAKGIILTNNNLTDDAVLELMHSNTWTPENVKAIDLSNNPITDKMGLLTVLQGLFVNAESINL